MDGQYFATMHESDSCMYPVCLASLLRRFFFSIPGVDASPLMTWGTIEGTPLHIDTDVTATPGQVFKIPKASIRDGIGLRLASKASKSQREKKKVAMAQATSAILGR